LALAVTAEAVAAVTAEAVAAVTAGELAEIAEELAEAEVALMEGQYQGHGP
jgi:hypothetical protein